MPFNRQTVRQYVDQYNSVANTTAVAEGYKQVLAASEQQTFPVQYDSQINQVASQMGHLCKIQRLREMQSQAEVASNAI